MFTGIVEETGTIRSIRSDGGTTLRIQSVVVTDGTRLGDSIAVEGTCLTVTALDRECFEVGLSPETLVRTNLGERAVGDAVNLERAVAAGQRLGGHYVQGHIDQTGKILAKEPDGNSLRVSIALPDSLHRYVVEKGFIAVDGTSLTVTTVGTGHFGVALVEYTLGAITLPSRPIGARVNLEVDVLAKYVERLVEARIGKIEARRQR